MTKSEKPTGATYAVAVGLDYQGRKGETPAVAVKGEQLVADDVVRLAKRFGIPVVERETLAEALKALEEGQEIPEELFEAVAVVLHELEK